MATTLHATGVTLSFGAKVVLDAVELTVSPRMRLGVLGPNGAGKSTLLGVLSGRLVPELGVVSTSPLATIGELRQEHERIEGETVAGYLGRRTGVAAAERDFTEATNALSTGAPGADDRYATALERWLSLGAADFEPRAEAMVTELGLDPALLGASMVALSGGQAAKVALAGILLSRFEVLLLDEPTNDLDFEGLAQLEHFVTSHDGPLVVVSHDRAFLDKVVTDVAELDAHTHRLATYAGGWASFVEERAVARRHAEDDYAVFEDRKKTLSARAQRERQWATVGVAKEKKAPKDNDKNLKAAHIERTEQLASRSRRTERALERLEVVEKPFEDWELRFSIAVAPRAGAVVARLDAAVVERPSFTLGPVSLVVGWGEKIGIVGPNGAGKSTLLNALLGRVPLVRGSTWLGPATVIGEIDQARAEFSGEASIARVFCAATGLEVAEARTTLAKFGLYADHVTRPASSASPGERTRAALALLQARGVNTLVLDEPTNHLDLAAIEQLELALEAFPGTVLLVTHDRRLLEAVTLTRILTVDAGKVHEGALDG